VLPLQGEVLALWEGGSATRIDARTLDTLGVKTWRPDLAGMPFSAHPKVDPDGTIWNFGVSSGQGLLALYEIAPDSTLRRAAVVPVADMPMVHDFAVTERHLVFLMPPLVYDAKRKEAGASFLDAHVWRPELGMRALVVDKQNWEKRQMLTLPAGFLFHVGNAWEEDTPRGTLIHIDYVRSENADSVFTTNREVMRGRRVKSTDPHLTVATLNLDTGTATQTTLAQEAEFPRIDPRRVGLRHRQVIHATQIRRDLPGFGAVARTDVESGRSQRFSYGAQAIVEEHVFVPDGTKPGWVLGTVLDFGRQKTVLSCFAADHLAAGPVAQATLPYALCRWACTGRSFRPEWPLAGTPLSVEERACKRCRPLQPPFPRRTAPAGTPRSPTPCPAPAWATGTRRGSPARAARGRPAPRRTLPAASDSLAT
jgi:all-trans-8'-apo-beta-carotenal 15,15'-oxygenase